VSEHKKAILALGNMGDHYTWPESDYGKCYVFRCWDMLVLMEIPMYGGNPSFSGTYHIKAVDDLISAVESWS